jgi:hypothetical protein
MPHLRPVLSIALNHFGFCAFIEQALSKLRGGVEPPPEHDVIANTANNRIVFFIYCSLFQSNAGILQNYSRKITNV